MAQNSNARIHQTQQEVDQVVGIMRHNVEQMLERDVKLSELDARADDLQHASNAFAVTSQKVKKKMWKDNLKMKLILVAVILVLLTAIILIIYFSVKPDGSSSVPETNPVDASSGSG